MRTSKLIARLLCAVALLWGANALMGFVLEPVASNSRVMWEQYRAAERVDTLFLGTSISEQAFWPQVVDAQAHTSSFNLSSSAQHLEESLMGLERALADHPELSCVVLGLEYDSCQDVGVSNPGRAFVRYKNADDLPTALRDTVTLLADDRLLGTPDSINWAFPWVNEHVYLLPADIISNVREKLGGEPLPGASWTEVQRLGQGFSTTERVFSFNDDPAVPYVHTFGAAPFFPRKLETLERICRLCQERGVELLAVFPPIPVFSVLSYGPAYFDQGQQLRALVEGYGGRYFDFNLARPELYDTARTDVFADYTHLNRTGAEAFSSSFGRLLNELRAGHDVDRLFYGKDEYLASKGYVDLVLAETQAQDGGILLKADAIAGPGARLEYQMLVWRPESETWEVWRDWSSEPQALFAPGDPGTWRLRVCVREQGSDVPYSRYRTVEAAYE